MDQSGQPDNLHPILSDLVLFDGASVPLTFTGDGKLLFKGQRQQCLTVEKEVIGFALEGSRIRLKTVVEKRDRICCFGSSGDLVRQSFVFEPQSQDSLTLWSQKLRDYIDSLGRPKRLLIFVNPFGGKKSATKIFSEDVKPYLEDADIHITLIGSLYIDFDNHMNFSETKHQLHAKEVAKTMDLSKYDGIVCVSGDGILVEVVNGLLEREDWSAAIKMPIGLIPAGTGNGMVKSLLHAAGEPCSASNAILTVIRGYKRSLDVATISQGKTRFFSVLMLAWGLIADIDIESEKYRWMGSARIDFYAVQRVFCLRHYNGRISFVPAPGFEDYGEPTSYHGESTRRKPNSRVGPFVSIWLHNVPWGGEDIMAAPDAKFSDGYLDLIMLKDVPKLALLSLMSNMNDGNYIKSPHITYIKVKAFLLEPGARVDDPTKEGIIDSDGEVIARGNGTYMGDQKTLMTYNKLQ
ncbi:Sphingosine kinase 2 [Hibiscus syriacus]|uniref:sphingosine kinase n=1 Tax=Hibiscus syriacus TaxID=106335 RepID=A0A6A3CH75_HIBSY|nr:Sphingosine kinase 2 [Hibiscus syriacus]